MKLQKRSVSLNIYKAVADILAVTACWYFSYFLRFQIEIVPLTKGEDTFGRYLVLLPLLWIAYLLGFSVLHVYASTLERKRIWEEYFTLTKAHLFSFLIFVASAYFLFDHRYSRVVLFLFLALVPFSLALGRSLVRKGARFWQKLNPSRQLSTIVIGEGPVCEKVKELIAQRSDWNLRLVSTFTPDERSETSRLIENGTIDVAFVTTHKNNSAWVEEVFAQIGNTVSEIIYLPDFGAPTFLAPKIIQLGEMTGVILNSSPLEGYGPFFKRTFDLLFALLFVIVFSPLYALCAVLVRFSSPGPIFYRQERMGLDGKTFWCLKFRGMVANAEGTSGPVWAKRDDDRTTPVGRWLRKTSLDEIPQFFNVLKGEMSIVGPRPERPVFVSEFRNQIPGYMLRHKAKAGITGWAQINGWRGNTSLEKRIECDLWYLQNWSVLLDIKICILTPFKGFIHPHAY